MIELLPLLYGWEMSQEQALSLLLTTRQAPEQDIKGILRALNESRNPSELSFHPRLTPTLSKVFLLRLASPTQSLN